MYHTVEAMADVYITWSVGFEPAQGVFPSPRRGFCIHHIRSSAQRHQQNIVDILKNLDPLQPANAKLDNIILWLINFTFNIFMDQVVLYLLT